MPRQSYRIDAPPADVFAVLADPYTYADWVVGCDRIRGVEGDWPEVGAKFHHTVGVGPLKVSDNTKVLEVEHGRRLVLEARARPAGVVEVTFVLTAVGDGTDVLMEEHPVRGFAHLIHNPLQDGLIFARNHKTLQRLSDVVRKRAAKV
jgi:uncharacterized protein YndB with AHSA1/START domain